MIKKSVAELHFVRTREPMATVELDLESLPAGSRGYSDLVENALRPVATRNPRLCATVYVYEGPSINFGIPSFSAFFGVAGDSALLEALNDTFRAASGWHVRYSDEIVQSQALCQYHLEQGQLWRPYEEHVWYADEAQDHDLDAAEESVVDEEVPDKWDEDEDAAIISVVRTELPVRYRAARSDATLGSICRSIEAVFGLPEGAVALRGPDKRVLRADATISTLRKRWK